MELATSQCSSNCFKFDIVELKDTSNSRFYVAGPSTILLVFVKQRDLYLSVSHDFGQTFHQPEKAIEIAGEVKDIQILSKDDQFVIAILERVHDQDRKRAISGWINNEKRTFFFKQCLKQELKGEIINISLSFREFEPGKFESVDHVFYRNRDEVCVESMGHSCKITSDQNSIS